MENSKKEVDYQGQTVFAGLDVHKKDWKVTIIVSGMVIKKYSMNPSPEELSRYLKLHYPGGKYQTVYEAGFSGYWIDRELRKLGITNIVVNPADVPTSNKEKVHKTDPVDSQKLARELSNGSLRGIYVPTEEQEALRCFSRLRVKLVKDQTRIKNRIKSLLNFAGIKFPENYEMKYWSRNFIEYLHKLEIPRILLKSTLDELLKNLENARKQLTWILLELRGYIRNNTEKLELLNNLQSISGIGFITAITLYSEIIDIRRFENLDKLCSYVGLIPSTSSSGENEKVLGMVKRQNIYLRNMIIESAWIAVRNDSMLLKDFGKLSLRMSKQKAIIKIAKKLLNRIFYVWKNNQPYITVKV